MSKPRWADMTDEDELEVPVVISKHGIKVKKPVSSTTPPHQRQDKTKPHIEDKK
jgi:hypothetical protein